jgi:tetratricopeptide (TPR) repeat protein
MLLTTLYNAHFMVDPKEHWARKAEELKKAGKFEEAVGILDKVQEIEKEEKDDNFWYKKAIHSCELGEYDQALDELKKDLEINQKSYETFFLIGKVLYELKKYEESLEFYNKASEEQNRQHMQNTQKIVQMKNVRKFEEAVKYSDKVYQEKALDDTYWHHKGMALFSLKKFNEASSSFKIALETSPDNPKILYELAKSELCAGNNEESFKILEKVCVLNPNNKEKLRVDKYFEHVSEEKQFRIITGLS